MVTKAELIKENKELKENVRDLVHHVIETKKDIERICETFRDLTKNIK